MSDTDASRAPPAPSALSDEAAAARKDQLTKDLARAKEAGWYL
jgi:hypothetical protein